MRMANGEGGESMVWRKQYGPVGEPPGTLHPPVLAHTEVRVTAIHYTAEHYHEEQITDLDVYLKAVPGDGVVWIDVEGLGDISILEKLGQHFGLHPLSMEDVLHIPQRPKVEDFDTYELLVMRTLIPHDPMGGTEQISVFWGRTFVLSFQERPCAAFEIIRQRLRQARGRIRNLGADYLAYALLDSNIDGFFPFLETIGERLENLEDVVLATPTQQTLEEIYTIRRILTDLRRAMWPTREAVQAFARTDSQLVTEHTRMFLRDCSDHVLQVLDVLESYRELAMGLTETYLSSQSHHLNEVMKVLTIISTIFIPLTFIAGIYGMNFDPSRSPWNMPELTWQWGYPFSLFLMVGIAASLVVYFRRKGWL
jgi:magnesium transporter